MYFTLSSVWNVQAMFHLAFTTPKICFQSFHMKTAIVVVLPRTSLMTYFFHSRHAYKKTDKQEGLKIFFYIQNNSIGHPNYVLFFTFDVYRFGSVTSLLYMYGRRILFIIGLLFSVSVRCTKGYYRKCCDSAREGR